MVDHRTMIQRPSRRRFLQVAGATGFTVAVSGGGYAVAQTPVAADAINQAPYFDDADLPPVAERVGELPLMIQPVESIGEYGGQWRSALIGGQDTAWLTRTVSYDHLVSWSPDWSEVIPNIAQAFEASEDGRTYTFHLRPGMKWSDGAPFTSADVEFYVNSVYRNPELTSSLTANPFSIEVHDDLSFSITWEQANGFALQDMCSSTGADWIRYPRHYLEQFHIDFNPDGIDALVDEAGAADWLELFRLKGGGIPGTPYDARWSNPELPRVNAWQLVEPYGEGTRVRFERNPYYWKIDTDGNQLPYIDEVVFDVLQDNEVLLLRASNGEIDFHTRHINTNVNKPVLAENQDNGSFELFDTAPSSMNACVIALNMTHKDEALRDIFQNKDFRVGLSHAINRQEIIDVVYVGQGEPWQCCPRESTDWYDEELAKQFTEYDVDLANEYLDAVLPEKDGDGMRLMPDGQPLSFVIEVPTAPFPEWTDACDLVSGYWQAVGVNAQLQPEDRSLMYSRKAANEHDCVVWYDGGGLQDAILDPRWYFPANNESNFGLAWWIWNEEPSNPQAAPMEPPPEIKEQMELYAQIEQSPDPAVHTDLFNQLLEISKDIYYAFGIVLPAPGYGIKKVNLRNVLVPLPDAWLYPTPAPSRPEQYYYEGGQAAG